MLAFHTISKLDTHLQFLAKRIKNQTSLFLVGGCVRDILLNIEKQPTDIDLTLAGNPEDIYKNIDKQGLSHFITEKFGTITLIKKNKDEVKYEITPLRTE